MRRRLRRFILIAGTTLCGLEHPAASDYHAIGVYHERLLLAEALEARHDRCQVPLAVLPRIGGVRGQGCDFDHL